MRGGGKGDGEKRGKRLHGDANRFLLYTYYIYTCILVGTRGRGSIQ